MSLPNYITAMAMMATLSLTGCGETGTDEDGNKVEIASVSLDPAVSKPEPVDGEQSITLILKLSSDSDSAASVDYKMVPGTASAGSDYLDQSGTITIPTGTRTVDFTVTLKGDSIHEGDENFSIELLNPVGVTINHEKMILTLKDEDKIPLVTLKTEQSQVKEGSGTYLIDIELSNGSQNEISIPFTISGLATVGQDYNVVSNNPLIIDAGITSTSIQLDILDDNIPEGGEAIEVLLGTPNNAEHGELSKAIVIIPGDLTLTDTGVTTFYDGVEYTATTSSANYPQQDALYGADVDSYEHFDGKAAFSYTKLDKSGNALASNAGSYENDGNGHRCVKDVQSGLTWESKWTGIVTLPALSGTELKEHINEEVSLAAKEDTPFIYQPAQYSWQNKMYSYYWYNSDSNNNGGSEGAKGERFANSQYPVSRNCAFPNVNMANYTSVSYCNTETYIAVTNALVLCGHKDWRLPLAEELRSIHDYGFGDAPVGTVEYFDDKASDTYFTSTPAAGNSGSVWCVSSSTGEVKLCNKQFPAKIRLVRGGIE